MSLIQGTLVYWNAHTGFGEIELDSEYRRIGIYRAELLRAGVKSPQIGDRFRISTGVADMAQGWNVERTWRLARWMLSNLVRFRCNKVAHEHIY
jgi:hypothetical protein